MKQDAPVIVTLTVNELHEALPAITNLVNSKFPIKTAYWLGKALSKVRNKIKKTTADMNEKHRELLLQMGKEATVPNEAGEQVGTGNFSVPPENSKAYQAAYAELTATKVELEVTRININALGDIQFTASDTALLDWLLTD